MAMGIRYGLRKCSFWLAIMALVMDANLQGCLLMQYNVGDKAEWKIPTVSKINYTAWAAKYTFHVEDTLHFRYEESADSVLEVNFHDYQLCQTSDPVSRYTDGNSMVYLLREGGYWFISGVYSHCILGQKFSVHVYPYQALESAPPPRYVASSGKGSIHRAGSSTFADGPSQQAPLDSPSPVHSSGLVFACSEAYFISSILVWLLLTKA
ncbi:hypothetical protein O6H91_Y554100 [Diphasiastrum complanatum]|nr:hypothetical protein O6H91_Y554100 [Diphasiastrum complanatum]KAJ7141969.1 hypothetical protein O6H91_Y554100 [Diphasiastrum complanatum]